VQAKRAELLGPEVTISHLLLKNHVADLIGRSAFAWSLSRAVAHLDLPLERTVPIIEQYEHYPPVRGVRPDAPLTSVGDHLASISATKSKW
jgi:hypothetical protein